HTDVVTVSSGVLLFHVLRKTPVDVADAPGFVLNRLLLRFLAEVLSAAQQGVGLERIVDALEPLGLPMDPFTLIDLVGPAVANHVLVTLHEELGPRYELSRGLLKLVEEEASFRHRGDDGCVEFRSGVLELFPDAGGEEHGESVLEQVQAALGDEVNLMLLDNV